MCETLAGTVFAAFSFARGFGVLVDLSVKCLALQSTRREKCGKVCSLILGRSRKLKSSDGLPRETSSSHDKANC
jgi:hypothetical protein